MNVYYSVIIPIKDERENLAPLLDRLEQTMERIGKPWELLAVDDGSTDGSYPLLKSLQQQRPYLRLLRLDGNHGQSAAMDAGFKGARGSVCITLDADLQNAPEDIPKLLAELDAGADLICGVRQARQDRFIKRITAAIANRIRQRLCGDSARDSGCTLKAYRTEALKQIKLYHGMHRFLPSLFTLEGFVVREVPVHHHARAHGKSKYSLRNRHVNTILDLLAVYWMRKRSLRYRAEEISDR